MILKDVTRFISAWARHPSRWLAAALAFIVVADLASMVTDHSNGGGGLWLLLDVGLAYRIHRRHGATALWWFRALAVVGVLILAVATVSASLTDAGLATATVARLGLYIAALSCALSPALDQHVQSTRAPAVHRIARWFRFDGTHSSAVRTLIPMSGRPRVWDLGL